MRSALRKLVNGTLNRYGYELRRKHEPHTFLASIDFHTVIDGGANVGEYAARARVRYPNAHIFSFEPTPNLFQMIQRRFAGDQQVSCFAQALSDRAGTAVFHVTLDTVSSSLLQQAGAPTAGAQEIQVDVTTLDIWAQGRTLARPALLKLDVEGNELAALRGAAGLLAHIDYVELETTFPRIRLGQPTFRDLLNLLATHGFELVDVYPGVLDAKTGRSDWADVLFARQAGMIPGA